MPIHDLGYRSWQGRLVSEAWRWWVITQTGFSLAWKNRWLRRLLLFAWVPAFYLGVGFFTFERWLSYTETHDFQISEVDRWMAAEEARRKAAVARDLAGPAGYAEAEGKPFRIAEVDARRMAIRRAQHQVTRWFPGLPLLEDRHGVWAWLLFIFFRYPQGMLMVLVVGLIAPALIAQDVRTRAFLLYFSRPLTRWEYILGKLAVVCGYLLLITTVPALTLYVVGVLLSPELTVVTATWDLPLRILVASAVLIIPTTVMALAFSSLTSETRYAGFAWFAVWAAGWVSYAMLFTSTGGNLGERWKLISLYHTLVEVESWVFGIEVSFSDVLPSAMLLVVITVVSLTVLFRRVSAPMRI